MLSSRRPRRCRRLLSLSQPRPRRLPQLAPCRALQARTATVESASASRASTATMGSAFRGPARRPPFRRPRNLLRLLLLLRARRRRRQRRPARRLRRLLPLRLEARELQRTRDVLPSAPTCPLRSSRKSAPSCSCFRRRRFRRSSETPSFASSRAGSALPSASTAAIKISTRRKIRVARRAGSCTRR